jgi:hypothetical protein
MKITSINTARAERGGKFLERLLELCTPIDFPRQDIDQVTGAAVSPEGVVFLRELFSLFGISGLDPEMGDFDTVLNTWYELTSSVCQHVRNDGTYGIANGALRPTWHPAYCDYVDALRSGVSRRIARAAEGLGAAGGIPEGSPRLYKGPLAP